MATWSAADKQVRICVDIILLLRLLTTGLPLKVKCNCSYVSRDVNLLLRAYLAYVRRLLEYNTIVWSPSLIQDIEAVERDQRKLAKRLPGTLNYSYVKIVFQCVSINMSDPFQLNSYTRTQGHEYKLYKPSSSHNSTATFLAKVY